MEEVPRTAAYQKNEVQERLSTDLNLLLAPLEQQLAIGFAEPELPIVFIVGPPRSGTTLVSQLLAYWGGFGYISNFLARFWLCPGVGAMIERALNIRETSAKSDFISEYGVTQGWSEPHEFGYFWNRWFALGQQTHKLGDGLLQQVDTPGLKRSVAVIESAYGQPMVFKNNTWCTFQIQFLSQVFPKSVFVVCERDSLFVAQSILIGRQERFGSREVWWSVRPESYPSLLRLPWWEQIAGQVIHTVADMEGMLSALPADRVVRADYDALCENPREVVRRVVVAVNQIGGDVPLNGNAPDTLSATNRQRVSDEDWELLKEACQKFVEAS